VISLELSVDLDAAEHFTDEEADTSAMQERQTASAMPQVSSEMVALIPARGGGWAPQNPPHARRASDADDLVQETLVKGIASIRQYQPGTRLKSWLFTIMRNTFYTRAKLRKREAPGGADCVSLLPTAEATQEWSIRGTEIEVAINALPPQQREVLILIGVLGISYEESARICDCAIGTIKSRLNRARSTLLELLGETSPRTAIEAYTPLTKPISASAA
jgi:RNA polymerase sigma factor (sigma-70 family)